MISMSIGRTGRMKSKLSFIKDVTKHGLVKLID